MKTELAIATELLAKEMVEREQDNAKHQEELARERARADDIKTLQKSVETLQATVAAITTLLQNMKPADSKPIMDALAKIDKTINKPLAAPSKPKELVFDLVKDGLGDTVSIVARKA